MRNKKYNLGPITVIEHNGFGIGLLRKRDITLREARHILEIIFGININTKEDFDSKEDYKCYNEDLLKDVTGWIDGEIDDSKIMEYVYDCCDDSIGLFNIIRLVEYLQKKGII